MQFFLPVFAGQMSVPGVPSDFSSRLAERVRTGLLVPGSRRRANYTVDSAGSDHLRFRAADLSTAISVGLNEVSVERRDATTISYEVRYWRWTLYCVTLSLLIVLSAVCVKFFWGQELQSLRYGPLLFWFHMGFWGFAWPWILTALHKPFASRCLERILREVVQPPASVRR
jgi:hypothetical protein